MLGLFRGSCDRGLLRGITLTKSAVNVSLSKGPIRCKSGTTSADDGGSLLTFSSIAESMTKNNHDISNVINPLLKQNSERANEQGGKALGKPHELPIKYVLNCVFGKNNSHFTYSAIVEDVNYLRKSPAPSYNEAFLYYLKLPQKVKFSISTGCLGFRKAARGEYEAAFQTATKVFQTIQEKKLLNKEIEVVMKDFGKGRAAFIAALNGKEGNSVRKNIIRISDKTALKFGGVRSPRIRRL